jgi:hypothetical protein
MVAVLVLGVRLVLVLVNTLLVVLEEEREAPAQAHLELVKAH